MYLSFFLFFLFLVWFSGISLSSLVFLACVLSTTDDVARLHADEAVEGGGDARRRSPLRVVDFEAQVEGICLQGVGDGLSMVVKKVEKEPQGTSASDGVYKSTTNPATANLSCAVGS